MEKLNKQMDDALNTKVAALNATDDETGDGKVDALDLKHQLDRVEAQLELQDQQNRALLRSQKRLLWAAIAIVVVLCLIMGGLLLRFHTAYNQVITTCAQVNEIAQGHVYLAQDAKRIKLVDELGGIQQALDKAAKLAKLDDYHYEEYPAQKDFFDQLAGIGNSGSYLDSQMRNVLGQFYEPFRMLSTIHQQDRIQARMPFVILYN